MVKGEVADLAEEDREDIRLPHNPSHTYDSKIYSYLPRTISKAWITDSPIAKERCQYEYLCGQPVSGSDGGGTEARIHGFWGSNICNHHER